MTPGLSNTFLLLRVPAPLKNIAFKCIYSWGYKILSLPRNGSFRTLLVIKDRKPSSKCPFSDLQTSCSMAALIVHSCWYGNFVLVWKHINIITKKFHMILVFSTSWPAFLCVSFILCLFSDNRTDNRLAIVVSGLRASFYAGSQL